MISQGHSEHIVTEEGLNQNMEMDIGRLGEAGNTDSKWCSTVLYSGNHHGEYRISDAYRISSFRKFKCGKTESLHVAASIVLLAVAVLTIPQIAIGTDVEEDYESMNGPVFDFDDSVFGSGAAFGLGDYTESNNEPSKPIKDEVSPNELGLVLSAMYTSYCKRLQEDANWRRQFILLLLSSLYWPLYSRKKYWSPPLTSIFFKVIIAKSVALNDIQDTNPRISRFLKRSTVCGFQGIVEEELPKLTKAEDFEGFNALIKEERARDRHLSAMLKLIPDLKWSLDDNATTIGYVYHEVSELHVLYSYACLLKPALWIALWQRSFRMQQRSATTSVMLLGLTNVQVTDRAMGGILILKLSRLVGEGLLEQLREKSEDDPSLQVRLETFELKLKESILRSVHHVLIRMSLLVETSWLVSEATLQARFPDVLVTAYRARGSGGPSAVVERGDFGSEVSERVILLLNQRLNENEMYVQLSVADPIVINNSPDGFISALKAASMFKQRLEDDPSLPGVGLAEVVYSTFNDLQYAEIAVGGNSKYDPDLHLLLQVPSEQFKDAGSFHDLFMGAILVQPLTFSTPRHVRMDRVLVMGYAKKAAGGKHIRMGKFGSGLPYSEQPLIDQMIGKHGFIVHVLVKGLKNEIGRKESEATAEEIFKRFRSRTRGTINVVFLEPVKPQEVAGAGESSNRQEGYPGWVIGVAVGSVTLFFWIILSCLLLRKYISMPWWIDCFCSPSSPFSSKEEFHDRHPQEGDLSRCSSIRPSVETVDSPNFRISNEINSKRYPYPLKGVGADTNISWDAGALSVLEGAHSRRLESKRMQKIHSTLPNDQGSTVDRIKSNIPSSTH